MEEKQSLLSEFAIVTGASESESLEYLESHSWDLLAATTSYMADMDETQKNPRSSAAFAQKSRQNETFNAASGSTDSKGRARKRNGPVTLSDLKQSVDRKKDPQEFFTGGEKSGLSVQGPHDELGNESSALIKGILKKARRETHDLGNVSEDNEPAQSSFTGHGYQLGTGHVADTKSNVGRKLPKAERKLTVWRNGISFDDEKLLEYNDPANQVILEHINRGQAPLHLLNVEMGQEVEMQIEERLDQDFVPPKKPFQGEGNRLGSGKVPESETLQEKSEMSQNDASKSTENVLSYDKNLPTTIVQVRLIDGTREKVVLNTNSSIQNLYDAVARMSGVESFLLQTSYPILQLLDKSATIESAKLQNAAIIQRMT